MLQLFFVVVIHLSYCKAGLRIIGGRDAHKDEFPYAVIIEEKESLIKDGEKLIRYWLRCTGAALNPFWTLSAAHCTDDFNAFDYVNLPLVVRYNSYFPKFDGDTSDVIDYKNHPSYNDLDEKNDICLFRSQKLVLAHYGKLSAVDYRTILGHEASTLGFGRTNASRKEKPLQVLTGMLNNCLKKDEEVTSMLCLVPSCDLKATICGGDSGGPVVHYSGIVGVNSMSLDDCNENTKDLIITPGSSASIIAMISPVVDWISSVIKNNTG